MRKSSLKFKLDYISTRKIFFPKNYRIDFNEIFICYYRY